MYKIVSFRYESVIQKKKFAPPPQSQIRSYGLEGGRFSWLFPDLHYSLLLKVVRDISKSNIDNSSPLTKYGNKMRDLQDNFTFSYFSPCLLAIFSLIYLIFSWYCHHIFLTFPWFPSEWPPSNLDKIISSIVSTWNE